MDTCHIKRDLETVLVGYNPSLSKYMSSLLLCLRLTFLFPVSSQIRLLMTAIALRSLRQILAVFAEPRRAMACFYSSLSTRSPVPGSGRKATWHILFSISMEFMIEQ